MGEAGAGCGAGAARGCRQEHGTATWPGASEDPGSCCPSGPKNVSVPKAGCSLLGGGKQLPRPQPLGPLGAGPAPVPSLEGVMCQHGARDKDSDCVCVVIKTR